MSELKFKLVAELAHPHLTLKLVTHGALLGPLAVAVLDLDLVVLDLGTVAIGSLPGQLDVASLGGDFRLVLSDSVRRFWRVNDQVGSGVLSPAPSVLGANPVVELLIGGQVSVDVTGLEILVFESDDVLPLLVFAAPFELQIVRNNGRASVKRISLFFPFEDNCGLGHRLSGGGPVHLEWNLLDSGSFNVPWREIGVALDVGGLDAHSDEGALVFPVVAFPEG